MNSQFLKLNLSDFAKGLVVSVLASVFTVLGTALSAADFDLATFDWNGLLRIAFVAFLSYTTKNLLSDESGKVLGRI